MTDIQVKKILVELEEANLTRLINEQTIFHLLIDKGLFTLEEIVEKKKYITKQYKEEQRLIDEMKLKIADEKKFDAEFSKSLRGEEFDREYMLSKLDEMGIGRKSK